MPKPYSNRAVPSGEPRNLSHYDHTNSPAHNRIQSSEEAQNMPVLPQSLALILSCVIICFASVAALNADQFLYAILLLGVVLIGSHLSALHLRVRFRSYGSTA